MRMYLLPSSCRLLVVLYSNPLQLSYVFGSVVPNSIVSCFGCVCYSCIELYLKLLVGK